MSKVHQQVGKRNTNQDNCECGVGTDVAIIGGECKLAGRHVVNTRYITHGRRVTRAPLNLLAICDSLAHAEVDEIVATARLATRWVCEKSQRNSLANKGVRFASRLSFTINVLNDAGVQSLDSGSARAE